MAGIDFIIGQGSLQPNLPFSLTDENGNPVDLTDAVGVAFLMTDLAGSTVISRAANISVASLGEGYYPWQGNDTETAGMYRGRFLVAWSVGAPQMYPLPGPLNIYVAAEATIDPLAISALPYQQPQYPYACGYAQLQDVQSRLNAAGWDPFNPADIPTVDQVNAWLMEATAGIDSALAARGYYVPLEPYGGYSAPAGAQTYQGIAVGAWLMLRQIAAAYAAAFVEQSRHGGTGADNDNSSKEWMGVYDDFLTRLENGADNLYAFGVGGTFAPEIDPAKGMSSGSIGVFGVTTRGLFSRHMNLGSGSGLDGTEGLPTSHRDENPYYPGGDG